jgi:hypothetical protein
MAKSDNLLIWSLRTLLVCVALVAGGSGVFYFAIASDAHTWPYLSESGQFKWQATILSLIGIGIVTYIFLVFKECLKRRNFDLDTLNDNKNAELLAVWILKRAISSISVILLLLGGTLIFILIGALSIDEYIATFRSVWIALPLSLAIVFAMQVIEEAIKRQWRKRKSSPSKPSHLP